MFRVWLAVLSGSSRDTAHDKPVADAEPYLDPRGRIIALCRCWAPILPILWVLQPSLITTSTPT